MLALGMLLALPAFAQTSDKKQSAAPSANAPAQGTTPTTGSPKPGQTATTPAAPTAQAAVMQVKKEVTGDLLYRFVSKNAETSPLPIPSTANNVSALTVPENIKPQEAEIEILDTGRGTMARLKIDTTGITPLIESAFQYAQALYIPVQANGKNLVNAVVTLSGKTYPKKSWLLKEADNGMARFDAVPLDEQLTVTVQYGSNPTKTELVTLTRTSFTPVHGFRLPVLNVDWKDVKTTEPAAASAAAPAGAVSNLAPIPPGTNADAPQTNAAPQSSAASNIGAIASFFFSLLFLGGLGYGLYWAYKNDKFKTFFDKMGLQPEPQTAGGPAAQNPFAKVETKPAIPSILDATADPMAGGVVAPSVTPFAAAPPVSPSGPRLVATMGVYSGSIFLIQGDTIDIGRDSGNGIALPNDTNASRKHATLQIQNGAAFVVDLGSSNGTFVNGVRISPNAPQRLNPGAELQIGMTRFRFEQ
jgi:hypothetical protein